MSENGTTVRQTAPIMRFIAHEPMHERAAFEAMKEARDARHHDNLIVLGITEEAATALIILVQRAVKERRARKQDPVVTALGVHFVQGLAEQICALDSPMREIIERGWQEGA